ncbi:MAG: hypothetical protein RL160_1935, partial [Bacteroidota bacterium]
GTPCPHAFFRCIEFGKAVNWKCGPGYKAKARLRCSLCFFDAGPFGLFRDYDPPASGHVPVWAYHKAKARLRCSLCFFDAGPFGQAQWPASKKPMRITSWALALWSWWDSNPRPAKEQPALSTCLAPLVVGNRSVRCEPNLLLIRRVNDWPGRNEPSYLCVSTASDRPKHRPNQTEAVGIS